MNSNELELQFFSGEIRLERSRIPTRCRSWMRPSYFRVATKEKRKEPRTIASSAHSSWSYLSSALSASALSHDQRNRTLLATRIVTTNVFTVLNLDSHGFGQNLISKSNHDDYAPKKIFSQICKEYKNDIWYTFYLDLKLATYRPRENME